jgi:D-arabinan exo alpha-(1,3)/(1,5)-arabinofuranosidase (non-reducing end)
MRNRILFLITLMATLALTACVVHDPAPLARIVSHTTRRMSCVRGIAPGESLSLHTLRREETLRGPGVIHHMWFTVRSEDPRALGGLVMRIWWDGEETPSVEVPMGDLFGVGFGEERLVRSAAIEMIPAGSPPPAHAAMNWYLPMPFRTARIEVENQSDVPLDQLFYIIDWERVPSLSLNHGRLHAQWRQSNPVERGRPHTALVAEGRGHYIGLVYSQRRLHPGSWVEGGEDFYIDVDDISWNALETWDRESLPPNRRLPLEWVTIANQPFGLVWPTLMGIGGEDYFGQSWGYRPPEFSAPLHGVSLGPEDEDRMTAYRFHLPDPIRFRERIRVMFRNWGWDVQARADDISTVAFWYQHEPHAPFPELPPVEDRLPPLASETVGE